MSKDYHLTVKYITGQDGRPLVQIDGFPGRFADLTYQQVGYLQDQLEDILELLGEKENEVGYYTDDGVFTLGEMPD